MHRTEIFRNRNKRSPTALINFNDVVLIGHKSEIHTFTDQNLSVWRQIIEMGRLDDLNADFLWIFEADHKSPYIIISDDLSINDPYNFGLGGLFHI